MNTAVPVELNLSFYTPPAHPFSRMIGDWAEGVETAASGKVKFILCVIRNMLLKF